MLKILQARLQEYVNHEIPAVQTGFRKGRGIRDQIANISILSPCLFNLHAENIMQNARLDESQAGIKIVRKNINNLRYADDTSLLSESEEELKSLLMKVKEESEKVGLKQHSKNEDNGIWSHHFMANRWKLTDLIWGAPKSLQMVTAAMKLKDAYSLEGKL